MLVVNFGFILGEKSKFSISGVLVLNTCKAESILFYKCHKKISDIPVPGFHISSV